MMFKKTLISNHCIIIADQQWEWTFFSAIPLIDIKKKVVTCPSCGYTLTFDEADTFYGEVYGKPFLRCAELLKPIQLTDEEMALTKAICVFNPGKYPYIHSVKDPLNGHEA